MKALFCMLWFKEALKLTLKIRSRCVRNEFCYITFMKFCGFVISKFQNHFYWLNVESSFSRLRYRSIHCKESNYFLFLQFDGFIHKHASEHTFTHCMSCEAIPLCFHFDWIWSGFVGIKLQRGKMFWFKIKFFRTEFYVNLTTKK